MVLYKYFSPERRGLLDELLLRFTPPGLFNDPFDSLPAFSEFDQSLVQEKVDKVSLDLAFNIALEGCSDEQRLAKLGSIPRANTILKKRYQSNLAGLDDIFISLHRKRVNSDIGVLCLCKNPKSIVMWSHYADDHKGFVVGFESQDGFFSHNPKDPVDIGVLTEVNYTRERPFIDIRTIKEGTEFPDILFTKNEDWRYEQEWRIIRFLKDADEIRNKAVHLFRIPPTAIREIIFGYKSDSAVTGALEKSLGKNAKLNHIKVSVAKLSKKQYEMDLLPYSR